MGMTSVYAQNRTHKPTEHSIRSSKGKLDLRSLESQLSSNLSRKSQNFTVSIPNENKQNEQFVLTEREILSSKLKDKFPQIKSFYGYSTTNPLKKISLGYSKLKGINAVVYHDNEKYIIEKQGKDYFLINNENLPSLENFNCGNDILQKQSNLKKAKENKVVNNPAFYRKYRLAIATDYSYNAYFAGEGEEPTLEASIAAVNETLTYILPIYENDLSISFELVDNLDKVTFLTEDSNPYNYDVNPNGDNESQVKDSINLETQRQLDEKIGSENYDLGILLTNVFSGGRAELEAVCDPLRKGSAQVGHTPSLSVEGYTFAMITAHEIGHQFGAFHTFSQLEEHNANLEVGSGVTIMSYPGLTGSYDVQNRYIPQFHNSSIQKINNYLATQSCGIMSPNNNTPPIANAGQDYSIPKGTAFKLSGDASDADNDMLTYSWEQDDLITEENNSFSTPKRNNTEGPNFRVYAHNPNPVQYFPPLENVLNNQLYSTWNMTSDVARELNFVFQVRDNHPDGGQVATDKNKIKITDNGPFKITNIALNQSFQIGETYTLKWDVAGTNGGEINTQNVRIKLTTDNGETFTTLLESTPNIGNATINLPADLKAEKANIIVEAIDNIYYAASPFIAIGYEVSLSCKTYSNNEPIQVTNGIVSNDIISINDEIRPIEDISLLVDADLSDMLISFQKTGLDEDFQRVWQGNCSDFSLNYKFNRFGENPFDNCGVDGAVVSGSPLDFKQYLSQNSNGEYIFQFDLGGIIDDDDDDDDIKEKSNDDGDDDVVTVNKAGIELCFRETTTLGVSDPTKSQDVFVYPNPTDGLFKVRMTAKTNKITANIINMAGQVIMTKQFDVMNSKVDQSIDAKHLPKGVYIVEIKDGNQSQTKKLIIK
ncbi:hypothetical protein GCM10010984_27480 [Chishuiella changwenlii]|nr:hypothetical protein GCM10010984_27480 [Chishuiella changwenlii]